MLLFLKIIIGCLLAIVLAALLCVAAGYLFLRYITKFCSGANFDSAFAIHLHEDLAPDWIEHKKAKVFIDEFEALGFTSGKAYTVEEMEQVKCLSFFHERYTGVLYIAEGKEYFFDIVHLESKDKALTVSTAPFVGDIESPPGKDKIALSGVSITNALEMLTEKTDRLPSYSLTPDNFRECIETYYKEEQAYRNNKGGMNYDEFQRVAAKQLKKSNEKQIRKAFIEYKENELDAWNQAALEETYNNIDHSEEDDYSYYQIFIVPNKTDAEAFIHYLSDYDIVQEEHVDKIGESVRNESNIIELFERINNSRSPDKRATERESVSFPVEARVYQMKW